MLRLFSGRNKIGGSFKFDSFVAGLRVGAPLLQVVQHGNCSRATWHASHHRCTQLTTPTIDQPSSQSVPQLEVLDLEACHLQSNDVVLIARCLRHLPRVNTLVLRSNVLGEHGSNELARLLRFQTSARGKDVTMTPTARERRRWLQRRALCVSWPMGCACASMCVCGARGCASRVCGCGRRCGVLLISVSHARTWLSCASLTLVGVVVVLAIMLGWNQRHTITTTTIATTITTITNANMRFRLPTGKPNMSSATPTSRSRSSLGASARSRGSSARGGGEKGNDAPEVRAAALHSTWQGEFQGWGIENLDVAWCGLRGASAVHLLDGLCDNDTVHVRLVCVAVVLDGG